MERCEMRWWREKLGGQRRIASAALWLCVGWASLGGITGCAGPPILINVERCPPGWPQVADDMIRLEVRNEAPDLRLYLAQLLEHCNKIEDQLGGS